MPVTSHDNCGHASQYEAAEDALECNSENRFGASRDIRPFQPYGKQPGEVIAEWIDNRRGHAQHHDAELIRRPGKHRIQLPDHSVLPLRPDEAAFMRWLSIRCAAAAAPASEPAPEKSISPA